jgi:ribonuclease P/MRP protein subunit RPP40
MEGRVLEAVEQEKDMGVMVHNTLKPSLQCARAAARANAILGQLSRAVTYRDMNFLKLYKVYIRPHLEYAVVSWSPWTVEDKETLEKVQRRAVGMVSNLRERSYEGRLAEAGMTSLEDRRVRGDMITTYKIMSGKDKVDPGIFFNLAAEGAGPRTRRAEGVRNIRPDRAKLDIRRYSFSQRVANRWNSLPDNLKRAKTVLAFKIGYDEMTLLH